MFKTLKIYSYIWREENFIHIYVYGLEYSMSKRKKMNFDLLKGITKNGTFELEEKK